MNTILFVITFVSVLAALGALAFARRLKQADELRSAARVAALSAAAGGYEPVFRPERAFRTVPEPVVLEPAEVAPSSDREAPPGSMPTAPVTASSSAASTSFPASAGPPSGAFDR